MDVNLATAATLLVIVTMMQVLYAWRKPVGWSRFVNGISLVLLCFALLSFGAFAVGRFLR